MIDKTQPLDVKEFKCDNCGHKSIDTVTLISKPCFKCGSKVTKYKLKKLR